MMQKPTKKQYATPNLKEHGVVRELTQSGSGSMAGSGMGRGMGMGRSRGRSRG